MTSLTYSMVTPFGSTLLKDYIVRFQKCNYDIDDLVYHKDHKSEANSFLAFLKAEKTNLFDAPLKSRHHMHTPFGFICSKI